MESGQAFFIFVTVYSCYPNTTQLSSMHDIYTVSCQRISDKQWKSVRHLLSIYIKCTYWTGIKIQSSHLSKYNPTINNTKKKYETETDTTRHCCVTVTLIILLHVSSSTKNCIENCTNITMMGRISATRDHLHPYLDFCDIKHAITCWLLNCIKLLKLVIIN